MSKIDIVYGMCIHGNNMASCQECKPPFLPEDDSDLIEMREEISDFVKTIGKTHLNEEESKGFIDVMRGRTLGDYDIWYKPCEKCGHDTAKSTRPKEGNKTCWKCGNGVSRDYSDRALKKKPH
jgi:hypothetical protein